MPHIQLSVPRNHSKMKFDHPHLQPLLRFLDTSNFCGWLNIKIIVFNVSLLLKIPEIDLSTLSST